MALSDDRADEVLAGPGPETEGELPDEETPEGEQRKRLEIDVKIEAPSACERHITVTVPREEIERYFDKEFSELMPQAQVPGFRPGRAPRRLVEAHFRKDVSERVKGDLLVDCLEQIREEHQLSAISEPEIDLDAVEVPDDGAMVFEFDLEVRPEFPLPQWKGLSLDRPHRSITGEDVERELKELLGHRGRLVPREGAAEKGDFVSVNLRFAHGDEELGRVEERVMRIRPVLIFRDAHLENFDKLMEGVRAGERREAEVELAPDAPNAALRGQKVKISFEVLEVKRLELPEITDDLLEEFGDFESEQALRDALADVLERRLEYEQRQALRAQVTRLLTATADWDLPPALLESQSQRELERRVIELRRSGFSDAEIQAREYTLRRNALQATAQALKEHFILERIAEEEKIEATEEDYEAEIALIARQRGESPRRVRARLEKSGAMDVLHNAIIEGKVLDLIVKHAQIRDVPYEFEQPAVAVLGCYVGGEARAEIPVAQPERGEPHPAVPPPEPRFRA